MSENFVIESTDALGEERKNAILEQFAKSLVEQQIHDPNGKTSRRKTSSYSSVTRDDLLSYLTSPTSSEKALRDASIYLYQRNSRYRNLLRYFANLPCWYYVIDAANYNPTKGRPDTFKKQYYRVSNIVESMRIPKTMRDVALVALREGVYYGVMWGLDGSSFVLQKLDPDKCVITKITDGGVYQFAYDMSSVKEEDLPTYYPPEFTEMYNEYRRGGSKYQPVPAEIGFCVKADPTIAEYSIPPFASVMPALFDITNVEDLSETSEELQNYKLLSCEIPVDENGVPNMTYDEAMKYYRHIAGNIGDRVGVCMTPFKITDHTFDKSGAAAQIDSVSRATANFFDAAGASSILHGSTNNTSSVVKLSIRADEQVAFKLMSECEAAINRFLKTFGGTQKFKVRFLPVSTFNRDDMLDQYKAAMNFGMCKTEYMVTLGIPQYDILNMNNIEQNILDIDNTLTILKTAATQTSESNGPGRPVENDNDIEETGEQTRENDSNANR